MHLLALVPIALAVGMFFGALRPRRVGQLVDDTARWRALRGRARQ